VYHIYQETTDDFTSISAYASLR